MALNFDTANASASLLVKAAILPTAAQQPLTVTFESEPPASPAENCEEAAE